MRLRIRSSKLGKVRFTGQRDAARIWERALRRASIPLAMTQGFHPRPKISFGLALPTGAESIAEYLDIELQAPIELDGLEDRLSAVLPIGFDVLAVAPVARHADSLQAAVTSSTWELWSDLLDADDHVHACRLLGAADLIIDRERKGKRSADDVRPKILDLRPGPTGDRLVADLATTGRALRPGELAELAYPDVDPRDVRVFRTHQWIDHDGERAEVLELPAGVNAGALGVPA